MVRVGGLESQVKTEPNLAILQIKMKGQEGNYNKVDADFLHRIWWRSKPLLVRTKGTDGRTFYKELLRRKTFIYYTETSP